MTSDASGFVYSANFVSGPFGTLATGGALFTQAVRSETATAANKILFMEIGSSPVDARALAIGAIVEDAID